MTEREEIIFEAKKELYKRSFYHFLKAAVKILEPSTNFDWNWHIEYLCEILDKEGKRVKNKEEKDNDYIINIPFRSMKSLIISVCYPAWLWSIDPSLKVMSIAFAEGLAMKQAYLSKLLIRSEWYQKFFSNVKLMHDDASKGSYSTTSGGTRQSFGLEGQITGSGADILIIDDPHRVNATSKQIKNANDSYDEMVYNRLNDPKVGVRFILGQRIKDTDLFGHLLENNDDEYFHINIPAELNQDVSPISLIEKYKEGLFWFNRFGRKMLDKYKKALGSRSYNAQLNQETVSNGGNILKTDWFNIIKYDETLHKNLTWNLYVDGAFTTKKSNDPSAILVAAKLGNDLIVLKSFTFRLEFPELLTKIRDISSKYCNRRSRLYIEGAASGKPLVQSLRKNTGLNVIELPTSTDKETRCHAISPIVESKRIYLIEDVWNDSFVDECTKFPLGKHDDQLDTLMYAIDNELNKNKNFNYDIG